MRWLVVGLGNDLRGDDAVGLHAARALVRLDPRDMQVVEESADPLRLTDAIAAADGVVFIDAIASGAGPGGVRRIDASTEPVPADWRTSSTHTLGLAELVELCRSLDQLPERVVIFGIEGADFSMGAGLSPACERSLDRVVESVVEETQCMSST